MKITEKSYRSFAEHIKAANLETNKEAHPSEESIHLFAMGALDEEADPEFVFHVEHCWHCGEIFSDAVEFQDICEGVDAGTIKVDVKLPDFEELKAKAFGKTSDLPGRTERILAELSEWLGSLFGVANVQYASSKEPKLETTIIWNGKEIPVTFLAVSNGVEVYSSDLSVVGRSLIIEIQDSSGATYKLQGKFAEDDSGSEPKAFAFVKRPESFSLNNIIDFQCEIAG